MAWLALTFFHYYSRDECDYFVSYVHFSKPSDESPLKDCRGAVGGRIDMARWRGRGHS